MALASPRQPLPGQQLTPPSSSHGGRGSWDFAVPVNDAKPYADQKAPIPMSGDDPSLHARFPRQALASHPNGVHNPSRSHPFDSQPQHYEEEEGYLVPNQVTELRRKASDITGNGSDPDSVLDFYRAEDKPAARKAQHPAPTKDKKRKKTAGGKVGEVEKDDSYWIHRDKLKEIESRELIEAGFQVGRSSRSNSRSQSAPRPPRDRKNSEATDPSQNGDDRPDARRAVSPIPAQEDEEVDDGEQAQWDLRTPEEIAAEREAWSTPRTNHIIRPSTSRIPIAKTSPAPVPYTYVERDAPLPRSRKGSANWSGDAIAINGARVRSGSTSSQVLFDEPSASEELRTPVQTSSSHPTSPIAGSPPKSKTPAKAAPTSGARKTSAQKPTTQTKPRTASATSPVKRPGTSGGSISRPTTSHRPEGDPPWIATMYKPDPRLPPDQQIIPTHAKRMQQEQWETEGKVGSVYDRDFKLLNTEEFKDKRASQIQPLDLEKLQDDEQWPLPSPTKAGPQSIDTNVRSPTSEQGNYKLTPTIPQSPRVPSRAPSRADIRPLPATSPKPVNTTRLPEPSAVEEKEKKGCCCIVM